MTFNRHFSEDALKALLGKMAQKRIAVIGDLILDKFLYGSVSRISPEAPVPVVDLREERHLLGGAANVVRNIASLGAAPELVGVAGDDAEAVEFLALLEKAGGRGKGIVTDPGRPTAVKTRIIAQHQQVVRFDREEKSPLPLEIALKVKERALDAVGRADAVVISDYGKGIITRELFSAVAELAKERGIPLSVDPKPPNTNCYRGAGVLTPNAKETEEMSGLPVGTDEEAEVAGKKLMEMLAAGAMLVTRGERGMTLVRRDGITTHIPTQAKDVYDVTGAGDTAISILTLAWAAGADLTEAALLANIASGIVVGKLGTAVVSPAELIEGA
ncbi:MAG: D-glycero-beta-D-manno-heptose-7-phosphate kinase [Deltaproteobacteria bacterium]|nr:MAG: D-glycero-beta-D-manno-heptose-7-phosphate kinase [Deltaproteobacteria bacterium]